MADFKTVIFDFDGVIANTGSDVCNAVNLTLEHFGFSRVPDSVLKSHVFAPEDKLLQEAVHASVEIKKVPKADLTEFFLEKMQRYFDTAYKKHCLEQTVLYSGIVEVVEFLMLKGIKMLALSSNNLFTAKYILSYFDIDEFFSLIISQNDCKKLVEKSGDSEILYIGNTVENIEAMKNLGFKVCLANFSGIFADKEISGCDYSVEKACEIKNIFC